jgi:hypothetical protein
MPFGKAWRLTSTQWEPITVLSFLKPKKLWAKMILQNVLPARRE